jgi:Tol biopolymer transport system component
MRHFRLIALLLAVVVGIGCNANRRASVAVTSNRVDKRASYRVGEGTPSLAVDLAYLRLTGDHWQVWVCHLEEDTHWQLTFESTDKRCPAWAIQGDALYFRNANREPFMVNLDGNMAKRILPQAGSVSEVVAGPDGKSVVYTQFRTNIVDDSDVWMGDREGSNAAILAGETGLQYNPDLSLDGTTFAYISGHGYGTHELFVRNINGDGLRQLTNNRALELAPSWSPDSRSIAYVSDATGDYDIYVIDLSSGGSKNLTGTPGIDSDPTWSPDGRRIAFTSARDGEPGIWIMDVDGGNIHRIATDGPAKEPAFRRRK